MSSPNKKPEFLPFADFVATQEKRLSSAGVVIENDRHEALVVKAWYKPYWSLPGGVIDPRESPREAAVREVREELGIELNVRDLEFMSVIHRQSPEADTYAFIFTCVWRDDAAHSITIDGEEITAFDWVSCDDVNNRTRGSYNQAIKNWAHKTPKAYIDYKSGD